MTTPNKPLPLQGPPSVIVVLDGSGNGQASVGPTRPREHWQLSGASVVVSTHIKEALCSVFVGPQPTNSYFIDTTATGSTGDICSLGKEDIQPGQLIWAVWSGGDAGAIATLIAHGTFTIGPPD
jgi:hypothetical protein